MPESGQISLEFDTESLMESALHTIHFQVAGEDDKWSSPVSGKFIKSTNLEGAVAQIFIDGNYHTQVPVSVAGEKLSFIVDAANYDFGLHTMTVQVVTTGNVALHPQESVFLRVPTQAEISGYKCYYTIDNGTKVYSAGTNSGGIVHADIDVASLSTGLHSIQFMLGAEVGLATQCVSAYFLKLPLGGGDISSYDYWVNDDSKAIVHVELEQAVSPFRLTALLPLKSYPLRSTSYQFRVENGTPRLYPRNDFNMLISSVNGQFSVISSPYYDANMPCEITPEAIAPGSQAMTVKIPQIAKNEIKFYEFSAAKGDSIAVKADKSCYIEMYDSEGSLIYSAVGYDVVKGGGAHSYKDGRLYLAVHDPANASLPVNVDIQRIDRYAILRHTPSKITADGLIFMNVEGNGFDNLCKVAIGKNDEIVCDSIFVRNNTDAKAFFNFYDKKVSPAGMQPVKFVFKDPDSDTGQLTELILPDMIEVSEAKALPLKITVDTHNNDIATNHPVSVTITNPGNKAYWGVPLNIAVEGKRRTLEFSNFIVETVKDESGEVLPIAYKTDDLFGKNLAGTFMPLYFNYIGPGETIKLEFIVAKCSQGDRFKFYAWAGEPWSEQLQDEAASLSNRPMQKEPFQGVNYYRLNEFQSIIGMFGGGAGNVANTGINVGVNISARYGDLGHYQQDVQRQAYGSSEMIDKMIANGELPNYDLLPRPKSFGAILLDALPLPGQIAIPLGIGQLIRNRMEEHAHNNNPQPCANQVHVPVSYDPNEITGYLSAAGTEHIGIDVTSVEYRIEFENDPEFATASAQTINITDRLDSNIFDLSTVRFGEVKLGSHTVDFEGAQDGLRTIDLRPAINALAQIEVGLDSEQGLLLMKARSLDPITFEPTNDVMQGCLPVNYNGSGIGSVKFTVDLKRDLSHNTSVDNIAEIVFDENEPISTPVWHNVTDYIRPSSEVLEVEKADDMIFTVTVEGEDKDSGIWQYDLYARWNGMSEWTPVASELIPEEGVLTFESSYPLPMAQFVSVAYDKAGNREIAQTLQKKLGDVDSSGAVDANDVLLLRAYYIGRKVTLDQMVADVNMDGSIDAQDATAARRIYLATELSRIGTTHVRKRMYSNKH